MATKCKWPTKRLAELAEFRNGLNYNKDSFGVGVKIVGVSDFQDYTRPRYAELKEINPEGIVTERNILRDGDIVFVRSNGNRELIGRSLFIEKPPEEITHSAFTIRLRFTASNVYPKFFAYCFRTPVIRQALTAYGGGTNISNLNQDILNALEVPFPSLPTQRKIAAILSAYDDLIENNLRRIKILEEMAQNLYREWYVKFRFPACAAGAAGRPGHQHAHFTDSPLGRIPEGWEVKGAMENKNWSFIHQSIGSYEGVKRYYATADIDGITITGDGIEYTYSQKPSRAQKQPLLNSVWFARMQETYKVLAVTKPNAILTTNSTLSSGFAGFEAPDGDSFAFLFLTIKSKEFHSEKDRYCTGATQRSLTNDGLSRILTISPPREIVQHFGRVAMSFVELILALQQRSQTLHRTRDLLLPRLISGEVDVSELDIAVPEEALT